MNREELLTLMAEANSQIKTTDVKGKDYAEVPQRVIAFRKVYPNGNIETHIEYLTGEQGARVVGFSAKVFDDDGRQIGSGHAEEKENSTFINKTSFIENCETSSVGRALGMAGFGIDRSVASAEEVQNAIANQNKINGEYKVVTMEELKATKKITNKTWEQLKKFYPTEEIKKMYEECGVTKGSDLLEEYAQKKILEEFDRRNEANEKKEFY